MKSVVAERRETGESVVYLGTDFGLEARAVE